MTDHVANMHGAEDSEEIIAGGAIFGKLKALGVDYVFTNSGTDFPPLIEGLIAARAAGRETATPVIVPHEHAAVGMAHGYYQISGRMQAVLLHTNVGLANGVCGAINAWCDQIPMFLMSGRTPVTEQGRFGARTVPIGWGQEMYDQAAMIREVTKWDYELRCPEQLSELMDRGWAIANSTPKGPVYLSLPREVLCETISSDGMFSPSGMQPATLSPPPDDVARAAALLAAAQRPVVIAQRGAGSDAGFHALAEWATDWSIPVTQYFATRPAVPASHAMHFGGADEDLLKASDVVLVIDGLAPWWPDQVQPPKDARVIQLGPDPLFMRTPVRNFPVDIALSGDTSQTLLRLFDAMKSCKRDQGQIDDRRDRISARSRAARALARETAATGSGAPMTKEWVSLCLAQALKSRKATVFSELGVMLEHCGFDDPQSFIQAPHSGGLGWGLGAALGGQLADPERIVVAAVGDGSYMFANPTACHQVAEAHGLPIITLVLNNAEWAAVRRAASSLYAEGLTGRLNDVPLCSLEPSPDFELVAKASRAYTETVLEGNELPNALGRAIRVATEERRQVLLNIAIRKL